MSVVRPDRIIVTADGSGNIPSLAPSPGVAFKIEPCAVDDKGNATAPGAFPLSVYFDNDQTRLFAVVTAGLEVLGGDGANPAFQSMGAIRATPGGSYLVTIYKSADQGCVPSAVVTPAEELVFSSFALGTGLIGTNPGAFALGPSGSRAGLGATAPQFCYTWTSATCWDVSAYASIRLRQFVVSVAPSGGLTGWPVWLEVWPTVNGPADANLYAQPYPYSAQNPPYMYQQDLAHRSWQLEVGAGLGGGVNYNGGQGFGGQTGAWPIKARYVRLGFNALAQAQAADGGGANVRRWWELWGTRK